MNTELIEILERFDNDNSDDLIILNVAKRKKRFKGYKIPAEDEIVKKICKAYLYSAKKILEDMEIEAYDFEDNVNGKILELSKELVDVNNIEDVFDEQYGLISVVDKNTNFDKFNYVGIRYRYTENNITEKLTIYTRYIKPRKIFKKGFNLAFMNNKIKELNSETIVFNGSVEVLEFNNKFYIIREKTMRTLFDYKEGIKKYIDSHLEEINNFDILENFNDFILDCKANGSYSQRLCKVIQTKGFEYIYYAKKNLKKYFKEFEIPLSLSIDNKIKYNNKEDINEILKILLRNYAFDGLNGEKLKVKLLKK